MKMVIQIHKQKGVAAVELALVILPMMILCFGITELGRALYQYNGLVKATRGAARYLSQQSFVGADADTIRSQAKSLVVCDAYSCPSPPGAAALVPGLTMEMVSVCDPVSCPKTHSNVPVGTPGGTVNLVSVTIGDTSDSPPKATPFKFTSLVSWVIPDITFSPITITMASSTN